MIKVSDDVVFVNERQNVCDCLPTDIKPSQTTPNINEHLLVKTRKRLKRLGLDTIVKYQDRITVSKYRIDSEKLSKIILEMRYNLYDLFYEPHFLLMGPRQFDQLVGETLNLNGGVGSFDCPIQLCWGDKGKRTKTIYGITVKVIPGFDNLLLVPKECMQ